MPWVPMAVETWPYLVEVLQSTGEPWPEEACLFDLRWLWDQRGRLPGRLALVKRWRVTERTARRLLKGGRWWDENKGPRPPTARGVQPVSSDRPAGVQPVSSDRPAPTTANADNGAEMSSDRPAGVQPVSSDRPAGVHTRVGDTTTTHSQHTTNTPDSWDRVHEVYLDCRAAMGKRRRKLKRSSKVGRNLKARLKRSTPEEIERVLNWWATSEHSRAQFIRKKGFTLATVLTHFEEYLELAGEPDASPVRPGEFLVLPEDLEPVELVAGPDSFLEWMDRT